MVPIVSETVIMSSLFEESMCIIPPAFIVKVIFGGVPNNPLELILTVKAAAIQFNNTHLSLQEFKNVDATVQAKRFLSWAFTVHSGYIEETSFNIGHDNEQLNLHVDNRHAKCIMPSLAMAVTALPSLNDQVSILEQLGAGLNRMGEANETANTYARKNLELKELEVENKKNRIKDLHPSIMHILKMVSATDKDTIGELYDNFKLFFNSKNHDAADIQLHRLMEDKNLSDVMFSKGVAMRSGQATLQGQTPWPQVFYHPSCSRKWNPLIQTNVTGPYY
jgi:hypothetical protein